mgnify:CR=1 FL=1
MKDKFKEITMWLSFYNKKGIGDTLLLTSGTASRYDVDYEKKGNVTQVFVRESKEVLGYNIEKISEVISFEEDGQQLDSSGQHVMPVGQHVARSAAEAGLAIHRNPRTIMMCLPLHI